MISDVVKAISKYHHYGKLTAPYWGRIGGMVKKYGDDVMEKAIKDIPEREIPLTDMLNMIERRCQYILENGEIDDLAAELLDL